MNSRYLLPCHVPMLISITQHSTQNNDIHVTAVACFGKSLNPNLLVHLQLSYLLTKALSMSSEGDPPTECEAFQTVAFDGLHLVRRGTNLPQSAGSFCSPTNHG